MADTVPKEEGTTAHNDSNDVVATDGADMASMLEDQGKEKYEIPSFLDILLDTGIRNINKPPPLQIGETQNDRDYIDYLLKTCWDTAHSRALLNKYEEDSVTHKELTYGEITATGVRQMMEDMGLLKTDRTFENDTSGGGDDEDVIFYDLGAGEGKLVVQIFLETLGSDRARLQKVVGVELSEARYEMSVYSWNKVQQALLCTQYDHDGKNCDPDRDTTEEEFYKKERENLQAKIKGTTSLPRATEPGTSKLKLVHSNLLEYDFSDATHIFASSIFFPDNVLEEMSHKLHYNATQYGKLKIVAALSDLKVLEQGVPCMWEKHTQRLQMSWGGAYVQLYKWKDY